MDVVTGYREEPDRVNLWRLRRVAPQRAGADARGAGAEETLLQGDELAQGLGPEAPAGRGVRAERSGVRARRVDEDGVEGAVGELGDLARRVGDDRLDAVR